MNEHTGLTKILFSGSIVGFLNVIGQDKTLGRWVEDVIEENINREETAKTVK